MDPDDLIQALQTGSRWAAPAMVTLVSPVLVGYAESIAPDLFPADHEAAVDTAIRQGVRKVDRFDRNKGTFPGWLRPFVVHALNDIRRERDATIGALPGDIAEPAPPDPDPTGETEAAALRDVLATLSDTDRLIITLRDYERLDYDACANRIGGVSAAACRVRHHRALKRLAEAAGGQPALAHYFEETP